MLKDIKSFFYNYLHLLFGKTVLGIAVSFASTFLIVRILLPEQYGVFVLFGSISGIIAIFTSWNSSAIVRFGREEFITENSIRKTFWANYSLLVPLYFICFVIIFLFKDALTDYIGTSSQYYYLIFAYVFLSNISGTLPVFFQAIGKMKLFSYLPLAVNIFFIIALAFLFFGKLPATPELVVSSYLVANLLSACIGSWLLRKSILPVRVSWPWIKRCFSYSWPMFFGGLSNKVIVNIDQLVIRMFMPLSFVAVYNVAYRIQDHLVTLPLLSINLMFPLVTSLVVQKADDKVRSHISMYTPQIVYFWSLLLTIVMMFSREIMSIFGPDYISASLPFTILLIGIAFRIFPTITSPLLASYSMIKELVFISVAIGIINLGLDFLLVPRIGLSGAAGATATAYLCGAVFNTFITRRKLDINNFRAFPWIFPVIPGSIASVLVSGLPSRILIVVCILAVSFLAAKLSRIFNAESLTILDSIIMPGLLRRTIKRAYSILI